MAVEVSISAVWYQDVRRVRNYIENEYIYDGDTDISGAPIPRVQIKSETLTSLSISFSGIESGAVLEVCTSKNFVSDVYTIGGDGELSATQCGELAALGKTDLYYRVISTDHKTLYEVGEFSLRAGEGSTIYRHYLDVGEFDKYEVVEDSVLNAEDRAIKNSSNNMVGPSTPWENLNNYTLTVKWIPAESCMGIKNYEVVVIDKTGKSNVYKVAADQTSFTVELPSGGTYQWYVYAVDYGNNKSTSTEKRKLTVCATERANNEDDWTDVKLLGAAGHVDRTTIGEIKKTTDAIIKDGDPDAKAGWVGLDGSAVNGVDEVDYYQFNLKTAAKLNFNITSTDALKFVVYELVEKNDGTFSLKTLQSSTLSKVKDATDKYIYAIDTKDLLLSLNKENEDGGKYGEYYIGVFSTNAKKGGDAGYNVSLITDTDANGGSIFYDRGDNSDDWDDVKTKGPDGKVGDVGDVKTGRTAVVTDSGEGKEGWVGFGDTVDYLKFTVGKDALVNDGGAKLSFTVTSSDNSTGSVKVGIYQLEAKMDKKGNITYSLKSLQSTTVKAGQQVDTKGLLLEGGTYYLGISSTDASKGGSDGYSIAVADASVFYTRGNNADDWTDLKINGDNGDVDKTTIASINANTTSVVKDIKGTTAGWVGYGDAVDYYQFDLDSAAKLSLSLQASDELKVVVYELVEKNNGTYSLKELQSTKLQKAKSSMGDYSYFVDTKSLLLGNNTQNGHYYLGVFSTNANKGGDASYRIDLNKGDSLFFTRGDNSDDWVDRQVNGENGDVTWLGKLDASRGELINNDGVSKEGWVGFDDEVDYYTFSIDSDAAMSFTVTNLTPASGDSIKFVIYSIDANNNLKSLQSTTVKANTLVDTKKLILTEGEYVIGVFSNNAKKGADNGYTITNNSTFYAKADHAYDWSDRKENGEGGKVCWLGSLGGSTMTQSIHTTLVNEGWVGYGDAVDYYKFELDGSAKVSFTVQAASDDLRYSDSLTVAIYYLDEKNNLKQLQSTKSKSGMFVDVVTKDLNLAEGTYYISVTSNSAKNGATTSYSIIYNAELYPIHQNLNDNTWKNGALLDQVAIGETINDWVGYGDNADYYRLTLDEDGELKLQLNAETAMAVNSKELKLTLLNEKGSSIGLVYDGSNVYSKKELSAGTYYVGFTCANTSKYETSYAVTFGLK